MREGRAFRAQAAQVDESQWWWCHEWSDFQSSRLRAIVSAAARDVPYYRHRYAGLGLDFERAVYPDAMARLPLLDKGDVREGGRSLRSNLARGPLFAGSTSGTTGAPLRLDQDLAAINRENAFIRRQLAWAGLRRGERRAWMPGRMIPPPSQRDPPASAFQPPRNPLHPPPCPPPR